MASARTEHCPLTSDQQKARKQAFLDSIDEDAVRSLASKHNQGKPCRFFRDRDNGSFNACFFVEFPEDDSTRWVVRIPIVPAIHNVWDMLQSEVATMRYIKANTTIPIPHVHAFGPGADADEDNPTGLAYLILDFIPGHSLDRISFYFGKDETKRATREQKDHLNSQLVDILAQLRQQEFDYAGSLMPDPNGGSCPVVGPMLSAPLNELQIAEGPSPTPAPRFSSTIDFAFYQYELLRKTYDIPSPGMTLSTAKMEAFAFSDLPRRIFEHVDPRRNHGPFVLAHADLRWSNIIVDDDFNIQGVVDWEWAGTIPIQYFMPPSWLGGHPAEEVWRGNFWFEYREFRQVIAQKALNSPTCVRLFEEWPERLTRGVDLPMSLIFRHYHSLLKLYYRGIFGNLFKGDPYETIRQFLERDGEDGKLNQDVQRRLEASGRYTHYLRENNLLGGTANVSPKSMAEGKHSRKKARHHPTAADGQREPQGINCPSPTPLPKPPSPSPTAPAPPHSPL